MAIFGEVPEVDRRREKIAARLLAGFLANPRLVNAADDLMAMEHLTTMASVLSSRLLEMLHAGQFETPPARYIGDGED
jgi:hypothetical protein